MSVLTLYPNRLGRRPSGADEPIVIGLVNNMPDKALRSTERQYRELLAQAAGDLPVTFRLYSFPGLPRSEEGSQHLHEHYEPLENLWHSELDGLIVTGTEPRAADLKDEPYWPALSQLVEWAANHTISTAWSCLAAHAAVRYLDGIERQPLAGKLSGVFECAKVTEHPLVGGAPVRWSTPHSRYNEIPESALRSSGYRVLARSSAAGADLFIKQRGSLFLFLQGHPEYDADALAREYRRDVRRFLAGERKDYPEMPEGYFDKGAADAMLAFRMLALRERNLDLLSCFPATARPQPAPWRDAAVRLYANWLSHIAAEAHRVRSRRVRAAHPSEPLIAAAYG